METPNTGETFMSYEQIKDQMSKTKEALCRQLQERGGIVVPEKEMAGLIDKFGLNRFPYLYPHPLFVWGIKTLTGKNVFFRLFFEDGRPKVFKDDLGRKSTQMPKIGEEGIRIACYIERQGQLATLSNWVITDEAETKQVFSALF